MQPLRTERTQSPLFFVLQPSLDEQLLRSEQDRNKLGQGKLVVTLLSWRLECYSDFTQVI